MIRVAVVGAGAWGINHVRTFARIPTAELVMVCDSSPACLERAKRFAPTARLESNLAAALEASDVDAVVLATPAVKHADQARAVVRAGKHVLVEKPLALDGATAEQVVAAADEAGVTLMVGHLMLYHPAFLHLAALIDSGEIGELLYLYALRVNLGRLRRDENAMWSLAPHDISMINHLLSGAPETVTARGGCYLQDRVEDVVFVNLRYGSGALAQIQLSWLDPRKERRLTVVGRKKMVEFDDVHPIEKLRLYDKGYEAPPEFEEYSEYLQIRHGDIVIPRVPVGEPLEQEARHFIECIEERKRPRSDGQSALEVVRVLEAAQASLESDGSPVALAGK